MTKITSDRSTWPTPAVLIERHRKGESWRAIGLTLNADRKIVQRYVRGTLFAERPEPNDRKPFIKSDNAFIARMTKAIAAGREKAEIGIKVDSSPTTARMVHAPALFSGCGSPAALCTDTGEAASGWSGYQ
jgi:hypothetical protein